MDTCLNLPPITVTTSDHRRLIRTAQDLAGQAHPLAAPLLQELHRATIREPDKLPDDIVALDSFVTYRLSGDGPLEKRALIHPDDGIWAPAEVSILTPVGLSLLGLRVGDRMPLLGTDGPPDACVEVEAVGPRVVGAFRPVQMQ
jgi:regulator of nucleoside diphosphate kinase